MRERALTNELCSLTANRKNVMNGQLTEEEIVTANNHMKTYAASLIMGGGIIPSASMSMS